MVEAISYIVSVCLVAVLVNRWYLESRRHHQRLENLEIRIHVNGTRGKSTVTRMIAGMLREANIKTVAKTTGTAAAWINSQGVDLPIRRRGPATILEQIDLIKQKVEPGCKALVIECMAIRPDVQGISESQLVKSQIGVITNIRSDHQDLMGITLPEIAESMLRTCPQFGVLVTSEPDPQLLEILKAGTEQRNSRLMVADPDWVTDRDLAHFNYDTFKENIAVGLAVASMLNIPWETAIRGMANCSPDPGTPNVRNTIVRGKLVTWANFFAANDRESATLLFGMLGRYRTTDTTTVVILNNRQDREVRALQFADLTAYDLQPDRVALIGHYTKSVADRLVTAGYSRDRIINLGREEESQADYVINTLIPNLPTPHVLLVGLANVHTRQASQLIDFFDSQPGNTTFDSVCIKPDHGLVLADVLGGHLTGARLS